jgi:hypothetical protein
MLFSSDNLFKKTINLEKKHLCQIKMCAAELFGRSGRNNFPGIGNTGSKQVKIVSLTFDMARVMVLWFPSLCEDV